MSNMKSLDSRGVMNVLVLPLILVSVFFVLISGFAFWAFSSRQDYKNHSDKKSAEAASVAQKDAQTADAAKFAQQAKQPLVSYIGPAAYGNITVRYPKTWSAYVQESQNGTSTPINGYLQPAFVPDVGNIDNSFALRIQLVTQSYDTVMSSFNGLMQTKKVAVAPFTLDKVPSVVGSRVEGQIKPTKQGSMVVLPLRNMTLEVWTESNDFVNDLNTNILPNLSFVP
jgi:hypothetical protein